MVRSKICTRCGFESYIGDDIQKAYEQGKTDAIEEFQEWLKNQIVGIDDETKEILVVRGDRWELAVDEMLKEQK